MTQHLESRRIPRVPRARKARTRIARLGYGTTAIIGYLLSPASWWNDAVVNIPLALALAGALNTLTGLSLDMLFVAAYWATNLLGIILMFLGAEGAGRGRLSRRSLLLGLAAATVYTMAVVYAINALERLPASPG